MKKFIILRCRLFIVAHELAHGAFTLKHTFEQGEEFLDYQGKTDNLMDYADGITLNHRQWHKVHNPDNDVFRFLQDEEEGEEIEKGEDLVVKKAFEIFQNELENGYNLCYFIHTQANNSYTTNDYLKYFRDNIELNEQRKIILIKINDNVLDVDLKKTIVLNVNQEVKQFLKYTDKNFIIYQYGTKICLCPMPSLEQYNIETISKSILDTGVENCDCQENTTTTGDDIEGILTNLNLHAKAGQVFEFEKNGVCYKLVNNKVETDNISDDDILKGNFEDADVIVRFNYNNGYFQISTIGINNQTTIAVGKTLDFYSLNTELSTSTRKLLDERKYESANMPLKIEKEFSFPSGSSIHIDENADWIDILSEGWEMSRNLVKTAEFEQKHYLDIPKEEKSLINIPCEVTGVIEGGATIVTDITSLIGMAYDLVVDEQARDGMSESFSALTEEVKDEPTQVFSIIGDIVLRGATGLGVDEYTEITDDATDNGRVGHLILKCTVCTAITIAEIVLTGGAAKAGNVANSITQNISEKAVKKLTKQEIFVNL